MKRSVFVCLFLVFSVVLSAQVSKTVTCTAGALSSLLTVTEKNTITDLTITGVIDARDFKTMRDSMGVLANIDLENVTIAAYYGNDGTAGLYVNYPADEFPKMAFKNIYDNTQFKLSLISIVLPSSITAIGSYAFEACKNLPSIVIPSKVKVINIEAFRQCYKLTSVSLPSSLTSIGQLAFDACSELTTINLPSTISYIGYGAFGSCYKMNDIIIPELITVIFKDTFLGCKSFTSVTLPSNIDSVGNWAFSGNKCLKTVMIKEGVKYLGEYCFMASDSLNTITIPSSVLSIGYLAFANNLKMKSINVHSFIPIPLGANSEVFKYINKTTCTLYVPSGSKAAYQAANQWKDFVNIVEVPGLYTSETKLDFSCIGGNENISVNSSAVWSAVSNKPWITVTPGSGIIGRTTVTVSTTTNSGAPRTGIITFSSPGLEDQVVTVVQGGPVINFPWNEGFENGGSMPAFWKQEQVNGSGINWKFITGNGNGHPSSSHGGAYNACLIDYSSADNKTRLISPMINLDMIDDPILSFWHTQPVYGSGQDRLVIYYKTSTVGTWTQLATYSSNIPNWTQKSINLPVSSSEYYICFEGNAKWGYGVCIDDVSITGTPKVQSNFEINNEIISNGEITCFNAYDTITVAGDGSSVEFQTGSSVDLIAGSTIRFLPGFHAFEGSVAHAWITTDGTFCDGASGTIVENPLQEKSGDADSNSLTEQGKEIKVYPNPNKGRFTVEIIKAETEAKVEIKAEVKVYNALGERVYQAMVKDGQSTIDLSGIRRGLYVVAVSNGRARFTKKVMVE
jgi:hypothetical protein